MRCINLLKDERKKLGFTQKELAKHIGISQSFLSKIEHKEHYEEIENKISIELLVKISKTLNICPVCLFKTFLKDSNYTCNNCK